MVKFALALVFVCIFTAGFCAASDCPTSDTVAVFADRFRIDHSGNGWINVGPPGEAIWRRASFWAIGLKTTGTDDNGCMIKITSSDNAIMGGDYPDNTCAVEFTEGSRDNIVSLPAGHGITFIDHGTSNHVFFYETKEPPGSAQ